MLYTNETDDTHIHRTDVMLKRTRTLFVVTPPLPRDGSATSLDQLTPLGRIKAVAVL